MAKYYLPKLSKKGIYISDSIPELFLQYYTHQIGHTENTVDFSYNKQTQTAKSADYPAMADEINSALDLKMDLLTKAALSVLAAGVETRSGKTLYFMFDERGFNLVKLYTFKMIQKDMDKKLLFGSDILEVNTLIYEVMRTFKRTENDRGLSFMEILAFNASSVIWRLESQTLQEFVYNVKVKRLADDESIVYDMIEKPIRRTYDEEFRLESEKELKEFLK